MRKRRIIWLICVMLMLVAVLTLGANALGNVLARAMSSTYYIPKESNIFAFRVLTPNAGSGDWWLYGKDRVNFYALSDEEHFEYLVLPKNLIGIEINTLDKNTWAGLAYRSQALHVHK